MKPLLKILGVATLLVAAGGCVYLTLSGPNGLLELQEKRRRIRALQVENAELDREIQQKRERIRRLRESREEQALQIRQRLKLVKPGDRVFVPPENAEKK